MAISICLELKSTYTAFSQGFITLTFNSRRERLSCSVSAMPTNYLGRNTIPHQRTGPAPQSFQGELLQGY